jgi:hypothetical protein
MNPATSTGLLLGNPAFDSASRFSAELSTGRMPRHRRSLARVAPRARYLHAGQQRLVGKLVAHDCAGVGLLNQCALPATPNAVPGTWR